MGSIAGGKGRRERFRLVVREGGSRTTRTSSHRTDTMIPRSSVTLNLRESHRFNGDTRPPWLRLLLGVNDEGLPGVR